MLMHTHTHILIICCNRCTHLRNQHADTDTYADTYAKAAADTYAKAAADAGKDKDIETDQAIVALMFGA